MPGFGDLERKEVSRVALIGRDYRGFNFELLCEPGDEVAAGAGLMRDARRPDILLTAPVAGRVSKVERGARRRLVSLQIETDPRLGCREFQLPPRLDRASTRGLMLDSGLWAALRTRPFGNVPDPDGEPAAILVTAVDVAEPQPGPIIAHFADEFRRAIEALALIADAPLYLCHGLEDRPSVDAGDNLYCVAFGSDRALPGTHINALCPIGFAGGEVWHIGYQEVIALGHLLLRGSPWLERVVAIGGDALERSRILRLPPGAAINQVIDGSSTRSVSRLLAGSPVHGQPMRAEEPFLRLGQRQVTALRSPARPGAGGVLIPSEALEGLLPPGILAVPLMRALQLGDAERARELGALELVEEDVAALGLACVSRNDYPGLLREVLDQLEAGRA